jgi:hypothetical protein
MFPTVLKDLGLSLVVSGNSKFIPEGGCIYVQLGIRIGVCFNLDNQTHTTETN